MIITNTDIDALRGRFGGRRGAHPYQRLTRQIGACSPTKTAATLAPAQCLQSLVLAGLAARRGWQENTRPVVVSYYLYINNYGNGGKDNRANHRIVLPRWRDTPQLIRFAFEIASAMSQQGNDLFTAISLNLTPTDAALHPDDLTDKLRKRFYRALGTVPPFTIERDSKGWAHAHAIHLGHLSERQRERVKAAGGQWAGTDHRRQLVAKPRVGFTEAMGWAGYMQKDYTAHVPHDMTRAGKELYEQVRSMIAEINPKQLTEPTNGFIKETEPKITTPRKVKVLEKIDSCISERGETRHAILKTEPNTSTSPQPHIGKLREMPPEATGAHQTQKPTPTRAESHQAPQSDHRSPCANDPLDELERQLMELVQLAA